MKKISLLTLLFVFSVFQASFSQTAVTGTVTDKSSGNPLQGVSVVEKETGNGTITDHKGEFKLFVTNPKRTLVFTCIGYGTKEIKLKGRKKINVQLKASGLVAEDDLEISDVEYNDAPTTIEKKETVKRDRTKTRKSYLLKGRKKSLSQSISGKEQGRSKIYSPQGFVKVNNYKALNEPVTGSESYAKIDENGFKLVQTNPLSTFSADVDRASYSNIRRFINNGQKPPVDAVRIEEMVNYFHYNYPEPKSGHPIEIYSEISVCPWQSKHKLLHIGMQGKKIADESLPPSNLVFLLDVSGSMSSSNKLPLLKDALKLLTNNLRENDRVAIVVYAGAAGLVLPSTFGYHKEKIIEALDKLTSGGSTAGGAGIKLAYKIAKENYVHNGNNRVILATDGDFNVGASSDADMEKLVEERRNDGIFLTCLGFGMGNYKDSKMETLADKGNGNYAYIDNIDEAKKTLVTEFGGTMYTIAKDVKLQVEFNPAKVKAYRLVGYENRMLNDEDFNDDTKDAGEMGAGHTVTALYEIIPVGVESKFLPDVDKLKYQSSKINRSKEMVNVKVRYKQPLGDKSVKFEVPVKSERANLNETSDNYRFSASVALFGMLLRDSKYVSHGDYSTVLQMAKEGKGLDKAGYRAEFIELVNKVYKSDLAKK
jgi:Ca-activated chloride channel homolog